MHVLNLTKRLHLQIVNRIKATPLKDGRYNVVQLDLTHLNMNVTIRECVGTNILCRKDWTEKKNDLLCDYARCLSHFEF